MGLHLYMVLCEQINAENKIAFGMMTSRVYQLEYNRNIQNKGSKNIILLVKFQFSQQNLFSHSE